MGRAFLGGLSPWLVDGHLLPVPSHGLPLACVQPDLPFSGTLRYGYKEQEDLSVLAGKIVPGLLLVIGQ